MTIKNNSADPTILLIDNGSTRADAAVQLRIIAEKLSERSQRQIHAVSMQHSNRISKKDIDAKLNGIPATVFKEFMTKQLETGKREFILIPLFFGNSRALTSFVPNELELLEAQYGEIKLHIAEVLYPLPDGDPRLVDILYEHAVVAAKGYSKRDLKNLVLVDHGSPLPAVNDVRQHITSALQKKLPNEVSLSQAAMERRSGKQYDFNGELLQDYLARLAKQGETKVIVLLLFLLAGTHAGKNGDIEQICDTAMRKNPQLHIDISPLIGQNDLLISLLADRLTKVLNHQ